MKYTINYKLDNNDKYTPCRAFTGTGEDYVVAVGATFEAAKERLLAKLQAIATLPKVPAAEEIDI